MFRHYLGEYLTDTSEVPNDFTWASLTEIHRFSAGTYVHIQLGNQLAIRSLKGGWWIKQKEHGAIFSGLKYKVL